MTFYLKTLCAALLMPAAVLSVPALAASDTAASPCALNSAELADAVKAEGKRFSVVIQGPQGLDAQDVILIPGLSSPRTVWDKTAADLAGCYRVHTVQIRGFGDDAGINASGPVLEPFVFELADYIDDEITGKGRKKPAIIGHSMGGLGAAMIAARHPQLVSKILIEDSLPFIGLLFSPYATADIVKPRAAMMRDQGVAAGKQPLSQAVLQTMSATEQGRAQVAKWSDSADHRVTMQLFYDVMTTDIRPELTKITVPVTLLYPHDDVVGPAEIVTQMYANAYQGLAGLEMKRIDNSRHFIMLDQPEKFAEAVAAFLK